MNAYEKSKIGSQNKILMVEIESHLFNPANPISVLDF